MVAVQQTVVSLSRLYWLSVYVHSASKYECHHCVYDQPHCLKPAGGLLLGK